MRNSLKSLKVRNNLLMVSVSAPMSMMTFKVWASSRNRLRKPGQMRLGYVLVGMETYPHDSLQAEERSRLASPISVVSHLTEVCNEEGTSEIQFSRLMR